MTLEVLFHTMKAYPGSRIIVPLMLNLSTRRLLVIICTPQPLYNGQRTPVPKGTVGRVRPTANLHVLEKRKISCICQESNCIPSTPTAQSLQWLSYPNSHTLQLLKWKTLISLSWPILNSKTIYKSSDSKSVNEVFWECVSCIGRFAWMWKITAFVGPVAWRSMHCMLNFISLCWCELRKWSNNILIFICIHGTAGYTTCRVWSQQGSFTSRLRNFSFFPKHPDRFWGPISLLFSARQGHKATSIFCHS